MEQWQPVSNDLDSSQPRGTSERPHSPKRTSVGTSWAPDRGVTQRKPGQLCNQALHYTDEPNVCAALEDLWETSHSGGRRAFSPFLPTHFFPCLNSMFKNGLDLPKCQTIITVRVCVEAASRAEGLTFPNGKNNAGQNSGRPGTPSQDHSLCPLLGFQPQCSAERWIFFKVFRCLGVYVFLGVQMFRFSGGFRCLGCSGLVGLRILGWGFRGWLKGFILGLTRQKHLHRKNAQYS